VVVDKMREAIRASPTMFLKFMIYILKIEDIIRINSSI
jgi:hypothetical protein